MKVFYRWSLCTLALLAFALQTVRADLIQQNDPRFGPNSLTLDTRTGLVWLDLPFSTDLSYNQIMAAVQPGGPFAGFRYATSHEVLSLYNSAGFDEGFIPQGTSDFQRVQSFISLVGATSSYGVAGITGSLDTGPGVAVGVAMLGAFNGNPGYNVTASIGSPVGNWYFDVDTHSSTAGNWLVVVPEPSAAALLIFMGALSLFQKRKLE